MRPRLGFVLVLGALMCALAGAAMAATDSQVRIVRLSYVDGQVQLDRDGSRGLQTAFLNMPLSQGSHVATGGDGYAEVEFENGGTVRLTPSSDLLMREMGSRGDSRVTLVELNAGTAYFNIKGDSDDDFRVLLQGQELRVQKSARFRVRLQRDSAQIAVLKGELQITGENSVRVQKDETLILDFQDRGRYFLAKSIETLTYDAWNRERDDYRERYASNRYSGGSRYSYGASDLNYYGSYVNVSGYGDCWRPYGVGAAWDPFQDGAWVWYPRWGYVWVSSYPWGWTPYRHGRWIYASGTNWCWQPGPSWSSWYYYPVIYRPPSWYGWDRCHPPRRRDRGSHGPIVIVGRGPYSGDPRHRLPGRDLRPPDGRHREPAGDTTASLGLAGSGGRNGANGRGRPSGLTPGVLPTSEVADQLKRVHGDDLGVGGGRGRRLQENGVISGGPAGDASGPSGSGSSAPSAGGISSAPSSGGGGSSDGGAPTGSGTPAVTPSSDREQGRGGRRRDDDTERVQQPRTDPQPVTVTTPQPAPQPAPSPAPAGSVSSGSGHASGGGSGYGGGSGSSAGSGGGYGGGSRSSGSSSGSSSGASSGSSRSSGGGSSSSGSSSGSSGSSSGGGSRSSGSSSSGSSSHSSDSGSNSSKSPK